jgi:hypothetical protein
LSFFIYGSDREKATGVARGLNGGATADRERENNGKGVPAPLDSRRARTEKRGLMAGSKWEERKK